MSDTGTIAGIVINAQGGQPLADAHLELRGDGVTEEKTTNAAGEFAFDGLAFGEYDLEGDKEGFNTEIWGPLMVTQGPPTELRLVMHPPLVVAVPADAGEPPQGAGDD